MFFDVIVIGALIISTFIAVIRGFVKEFFTLLSWVIAIVVTVYLGPVLQDALPEKDGYKAIYDSLAILAVFICSMIICSISFGSLVRRVKTGGNVLLFDRSLGGVFGFLRGVLLVTLAYIFLNLFFYEDTEKPEWLQGKTTVYVEKVAVQLIKLNPKNILDKNKDLLPDERKEYEGKLPLDEDNMDVTDEEVGFFDKNSNFNFGEFLDNDVL